MKAEIGRALCPQVPPADKDRRKKGGVKEEVRKERMGGEKETRMLTCVDRRPRSSTGSACVGLEFTSRVFETQLFWAYDLFVSKYIFTMTILICYLFVWILRGVLG